MTREQFIHLVKHEQGPLRRFLRVLCRGDEAMADDIAQEALLKAYLHYQDFKGKSRFSTWLFRIGYNCFCDLQKSSGQTLPLEKACEVHEDIPEEGRYRELWRAIGTLGEAERSIILLFYMEERSIKEIGEITGIPSGTIRSHLSRARSRLRQIIAKNEKLAERQDYD